MQITLIGVAYIAVMDAPNSFKSVKSALTIVDLKGYVKVYKSDTLHMQGVNVEGRRAMLHPAHGT